METIQFPTALLSTSMPVILRAVASYLKSWFTSRHNSHDTYAAAEIAKIDDYVAVIAISGVYR